jgi:hypothetical protein
MAVAHLTLEEAAEQLGITPDDFKKRLKTETAFKSLVPIRDGSSLRFKSAAIEELARQLGVASNPELPLAPLESESLPPDSDDFKVPSIESKKEAKPVDEPLNLTSSSDDDIFSLAPEGHKGADKKLNKPGSDSDVRLESSKPKKGKSVKDDSDESVVPTEELSIDFNGPGSAVIKGGSSAKLSAPKSSGKIPKPDSGKALANTGASDSSEFELSLDADSDDFELKLNTDASDEVDLGEMPKDTSGSAKRTGESGINLREPADSGISLEKNKGKDKAAPEKAKLPEPESESDVDFELTLDSSVAASSLKLGGLKPGKAAPSEADSDSEFELTLDDSSDSGLDAAAQESLDAEKRDIFETDFEIPPMDESGSEAVALDPDTDLERSDSDLVENTDSDVLVEDSGDSSDVVLEDEEEAPKAKGKKKPVARKAAGSDEDDVDLADVDLADEEDASASKALKGLKGRRPDEEEEDEADAVAVPAGAYRPVPWGPLPALFLLPTLLFTIVGALVSYELLQTMWGYQQPRKPAAPLVRAIASNLDLELRDQ